MRILGAAVLGVVEAAALEAAEAVAVVLGAAVWELFP